MRFREQLERLVGARGGQTRAAETWGIPDSTISGWRGSSERGTLPNFEQLYLMRRAGVDLNTLVAGDGDGLTVGDRLRAWLISEMERRGLATAVEADACLPPGAAILEGLVDLGRQTCAEVVEVQERAHLRIQKAVGSLRAITAPSVEQVAKQVRPRAASVVQLSMDDREGVLGSLVSNGIRGSG